MFKLCRHLPSLADSDDDSGNNEDEDSPSNNPSSYGCSLVVAVESCEAVLFLLVCPQTVFRQQGLGMVGDLERLNLWLEEGLMEGDAAVLLLEVPQKLTLQCSQVSLTIMVDAELNDDHILLRVLGFNLGYDDKLFVHQQPLTQVIVDDAFDVFHMLHNIL